LACGHIDFEEKFKSDEEFVCPTCGKTLRTIGVDYRRPGTLYKCRNCNEIFPNPKKRYICSNGHSGDENELVLRNINVYKPNPAKHALIEREIIELGSILEELTAKGWHGQAPAMLRGKSGIVHTFTLALWAPESNPASERPDILADWCTAEVEVDSTMVLAFYAKTLDVTPRESLLFVIPRTGIEAKVLAESFNISIIEVEDLTELKGKARIQLLNMASTLQALKTALRKLD